MSEQITFEEALDGLTGKQRAFVLAYLDCLNKSEAARRASYANPGEQGYRLYKNVRIRAAVRLGFERLTMPKEEVIARLSATAWASLEDFITLEASPGADDSEYPVYFQPQTPPNGKRKQNSEDESDEENTSQSEKNPVVPHPGNWRLDLAKAKRRGVLGALKKLKWGKHGPEIELYSPLEAQQLLGKYHRLFIERQEVSGPDGSPVQIDVRARDKAEAELAEWRKAQQEALKASNG